MSRINLRSWVMWFLVVSFFAYQFVMRLYPGLAMHNIMDKFDVDATSFGVMSSMYYLGYASMQIPMAILLDRFGPRRVIALFALICSLSTMLFVESSSWNVILFSRFLIGLGSAVGFLGVSKVISLVFPENRYAQMVGLSFSFGLMGALYGGLPTSYLVDAFGWETVGTIIFVVGCFIACAIFIFVRVPTNNAAQKDMSIVSALLDLFRNPKVLALAIANLLMVGVLEGFADVWGVSYFMKVYGFDKGVAASVTSFIFVGMLFGGPLLAAIAQRFDAYRQVTAVSGLLIAALFSLMLVFGTHLSYVILCLIMLLIGILCCYQVLVFAIGSSLVPVAMMGITVAFLNSINMFGGSFFHLVIGSLLDYFWQGEMLLGMRDYTAHAYTCALAAIPVAAIAGASLLFVLREESAKRSIVMKAHDTATNEN